MATIVYENDDVYYKGVVTTPGTILDELNRTYPRFTSLIITGNLAKLYDVYINDDYRDDKLTVFVPLYIPDKNYSIEESIAACKMSTLRGRISLDTLRSSPRMVLKSLNAFNDVIVESYETSTFVNGSKISVDKIASCSNGNIVPIEYPIWRY